MTLFSDFGNSECPKFSDTHNFKAMYPVLNYVKLTVPLFSHLHKAGDHLLTCLQITEDMKG